MKSTQWSARILAVVMACACSTRAQLCEIDDIGNIGSSGAWTDTAEQWSNHRVPNSTRSYVRLAQQTSPYTVLLDHDISIGYLDIASGAVLDVGSTSQSTGVHLDVGQGACESPLCAASAGSSVKDSFVALNAISTPAYDATQTILTTGVFSYNVSCADGFEVVDSSYSPPGSEFRLYCNDSGAIDTSAATCHPIDGESLCSAAVWSEANDGQWANDDNYVGGSAPSLLTAAVLPVLDGSAPYVVLVESDDAAAWSLDIEVPDSGDGVVGGFLDVADGAMLTVGDPELSNPTCSDAKCDVSTVRVPDGFELQVLSGSSSLNVETGQVELDDVRAVRFSCSEGYSSSAVAGSSLLDHTTMTVDVFCGRSGTFANFDIAAHLACTLRYIDGCPATEWASDEDGAWEDDNQWLSSHAPSKFDVAILGSSYNGTAGSAMDGAYVVTVDAASISSDSASLTDVVWEALELEIDAEEGVTLDVFSGVLSIGELLYVSDDLCGSSACDAGTDIELEDGYVAVPMSSSYVLDSRTGSVVESVAKVVSVHCDEGYYSLSDAETLQLTCSANSSFSDAEITAELLCQRVPEEGCPAAAWTSAYDGLWDNSTNWESGHVATELDAALLFPSADSPVVSVTSGAEAYSLTVGGDAAGDAGVVLDVDGGFLDIGANALAPSLCGVHDCDWTDITGSNNLSLAWVSASNVVQSDGSVVSTAARAAEVRCAAGSFEMGSGGDGTVVMVCNNGSFSLAPPTCVHPLSAGVDFDSDGISTSMEGGGDSDSDGVADYLDSDADGDGIPDAAEDAGDSDSDGVPDYLDLDSDNDGIPDAVEGAGDADSDGVPDYADTDSDNDGISDAVEGTGDADSDGIANSVDTDSDGDGIDDSIEGAGDVDSDGIPDYADTDSDNDGVSDAVEGDGDRDSDSVPDYLDTDSDNDGISDADEASNDLDSDSIPDDLDDDADGDGIDNADEGNGDADSDGISNNLDSDSDNDGISDGVENASDVDSDGIPAYLDVDSDNDGINDAQEGDGDADSDGVANFLDSDSDNDGIPDAVEGDADFDSDGIPNSGDSDSDGDGIDDSVEGTADADSDGIPNFVDDGRTTDPTQTTHVPNENRTTLSTVIASTSTLRSTSLQHRDATSIGTSDASTSSTDTMITTVHLTKTPSVSNSTMPTGTLTNGKALTTRTSMSMSDGSTKVIVSTTVASTTKSTDTVRTVISAGNTSRNMTIADTVLSVTSSLSTTTLASNGNNASTKTPTASSSSPPSGTTASSVTGSDDTPMGAAMSVSASTASTSMATTPGSTKTVRTYAQANTTDAGGVETTNYSTTPVESTEDHTKASHSTSIPVATSASLQSPSTSTDKSPPTNKLSSTTSTFTFQQSFTEYSTEHLTITIPGTRDPPVNGVSTTTTQAAVTPFGPGTRTTTTSTADAARAAAAAAAQEAEQQSQIYIAIAVATVVVVVAVVVAIVVVMKKKRLQAGRVLPITTPKHGQSLPAQTTANAAVTISGPPSNLRAHKRRSRNRRRAGGDRDKPMKEENAPFKPASVAEMRGAEEFAM